MNIIIRPWQEPRLETDLNSRLVSVIAEEIWRLYGADGQLNWPGVERHLAHLVGQARAEAMETELLNLPLAGRLEQAARARPSAAASARARGALGKARRPRAAGRRHPRHAGKRAAATAR